MLTVIRVCVYNLYHTSVVRRAWACNKNIFIDVCFKLHNKLGIFSFSLLTIFYDGGGG